jgi:hypothetical protein
MGRRAPLPAAACNDPTLISTENKRAAQRRPPAPTFSARRSGEPVGECDATFPNCANTAIRTQTYKILGPRRFHLCVDHWLMANNSPLTLHRMLGIPERGADPTPTDPKAPANPSDSRAFL